MERNFVNFVLRNLIQRRIVQGTCGRQFHTKLNGFGQTKVVNNYCNEAMSLSKPLSLRTYWCTLFSRRNNGYLCHSLPSKKVLIRPIFENMTRFRKTFDAAPLLFYSTQPKLEPKPSNASDRHSEQCDSVDNTSDLAHTPRPLENLDEHLIDVDKVAKFEGNTHLEEKPFGQVVNKESEGDDSNSKESENVVTTNRPGLFKRFHQTYKQYGKVLVGVHIFTSSIWAALFYTIAVSGVDLEPALRWIGAGEKIISFSTMPGVGHAAVAYLMYKLATPVRYPVTIGGTHLTVKILQRCGYMKPIPESDKIRSLVKDSQTKVKAKYEEYQDKMGDIRDELKELASRERKAN